MGQYHQLTNMDRSEYLNPHEIGCGLKAWEQTGGGTPASLAFLIAAHPGNMPADVGHHPMAGRWAGNRLLAVGDYAENSDIPRFNGPPLKRIYGLCSDAPKLEDFEDRWYWSDKKNGSSQYGGYSLPYGFGISHVGLKRYCETAKEQYRKALVYERKITANGKYEYFHNVSPSLPGALESALSVRFCGDGWKTMVPVKPYAERGNDGHLHYRIADSVTREPNEWDLTLRMCGIGGWKESPLMLWTWEVMPNGERWPWDRPPADLSWHDAADKHQDMGQERVYANLDRREYFDPRAFGEVPTTLGIMRAAQWDKSRHCIDMLVTADGGVENDVKTGGSTEFSSAASLWAMLLHPEVRGGGDIHPEQFPLIGHWRNNRLVLTSERTSDDLPSTDEVTASFDDISDDVLKSAIQASRD